MTRVRPTFLLSLALLLASCALPPGPQPTPTVVGFTSYGRFIFRDPDKFPTDLTAGPDGAVWFTERRAAIGRLTPTCFIPITGIGVTPLCAFLEFALPNVHSGPVAITFGPDGAFWFTDWGTDSIGRMTLTGAVTEFALQRPLTPPWDITTGPDGALWFTEAPLGSNAPAGAIGRITSAGVITQFPLPALDGPVLTYSPDGALTSGPDGALWFVDTAGIGRITPAGAITEFPLAGGGPQSITTGPDGALWFTGPGNQIGRITPAGAIREFPMPTGGEPRDIVTGPDGALWFTEFWGPVLGRVTVSGVFAQIPLQSHTSGMQQPYDPRVITLGPDGALWFTQQADLSLWRVTPATRASRVCNSLRSPLSPLLALSP